VKIIVLAYLLGVGVLMTEEQKKEYEKQLVENIDLIQFDDKSSDLLNLEELQQLIRVCNSISFLMLQEINGASDRCHQYYTCYRACDRV
jgi:hypothetical protein